MTQESNWYSAETATFGDRLAGAREAAGLDQKTLASKLGIRASLLADWENDIKEPRSNRLQMVAGIVGVSITWLLTGEGDGIDAPVEAQPTSPEVVDMLAELRKLRGEVAQTGEKLGRLEKRLRKALQE